MALIIQKKERATMRYTLAITTTLICDFVLLCADVIMTGNLALWLAIHIAEDLYLAWLLKNSVIRQATF